MASIVQTAQEAAMRIAESDEFRLDPAGQINGCVSRAMSSHPWNPTEARRLTYTACWLVFAANNPLVVRGDALERLVRIYGDGLPSPDDGGVIDSPM